MRVFTIVRAPVCDRTIVNVGRIREDVYLVIVEPCRNKMKSLDDAVISIVAKVLNPKDGSFYLYCKMCKSEDCACTEDVRAFRRGICLDPPDNKD
jgi:hypothetical protein